MTAHERAYLGWLVLGRGHDDLLATVRARAPRQGDPQEFVKQISALGLDVGQ